MKKKLIKGFKARFAGGVLMVVCCIITVLIFQTTIRIKKSYENLAGTMNDYVNCESAIIGLKKNSGKLTYYAICFLYNTDFDYLDRYNYLYNEVNKKGKTLEIVRLSHNDDVIEFNTELAVKESDLLTEIETYAMRLFCDALDLEKDELLPMLQNINIKPEHEKLSNEEKAELARKIVFSDLHLRSRDLIAGYSELAAQSLYDTYRSKEVESKMIINNQFIFQKVMIIILLILCVVLYLLLVFAVFIPLHRHLLAIQNGDKMDVKGAYEVRYIATAYNALCDRNALDASALKHKAEHDPLTGLINRSAFDHIISVLSKSNEPVAYLIIDIDLFKNVNDKYGHPVGDEVLKKIAGLLTEQFRATDYIARIGGDEFAVIMTKFGTSAIDIIRRKIDGMNNMLKNTDDNLPPVSLSVGVAFSDTGFRSNLVENADKALYKVKRGGRCNCYFYGS